MIRPTHTPADPVTAALVEARDLLAKIGPDPMWHVHRHDMAVALGMICSASGCHERARHYGWCVEHSKQWRRMLSGWPTPRPTMRTVEDVEDLLDKGATGTDILRAFDAKPHSVKDALRRAGRHDLARKVSA